MQSNSVPTTSSAAVLPFRPTLAYSADAERRNVEAWMREHGLWRTTLYSFLRRHREVRLGVTADALTFLPGDRGQFRVALAPARDGWRVDAGALSLTYEQATIAAGIFCAAVSGDVRIVTVERGDGGAATRLQLRDGAEAWIDLAVEAALAGAATARPLRNPVL